MERSRRVALVAHCILNANSRIDGVARYQGVHPLVAELANRGYGIIQLPCPELASEGLERPRKTKAAYDTPTYREHCSRLAKEAAAQVAVYLDGGYEVAALVGVDGSPSCGIEVTSEAADDTSEGTRRTSGRGVFAEELARHLAPYDVPLTAVDGRDEDLGVVRALRFAKE